MVVVPSTMSALGNPAPNFSLPEPATGRTVSLADFRASEALLVAFWSNHCPFVQHIADHFARLAERYRRKGVGIVAINANDVIRYPEDNPERMSEEVKRRGYGFPYLFDERQDVAKAYEAACTPDFFLYDRHRTLVYRGQYDSSRPSLGVPVTGEDLGRALDAVLAGEAPLLRQVHSVGCNIKWKPGTEPAWFG